MAYFAMPDAIAFATVVSGAVAIAYRFKPSSKSNGNGKVSSKDIEAIKTEMNKKQDKTMCEVVKNIIEQRHDDLKSWTFDISKQQTEMNKSINELKTEVAIIVGGIKILQERRIEKRDD